MSDGNRRGQGGGRGGGEVSRIHDGFVMKEWKCMGKHGGSFCCEKVENKLNSHAI